MLSPAPFSVRPSRARPVRRRPSPLARLAALTGALAVAAACGDPVTDAQAPDTATASTSYDQLLRLFEEWRSLEPPPLLDGAPDYRPGSNERRLAGLRDLQARLRAIDPSGWPIPRQVDYHLVRAEMNGMEFHLRVLRPFARDPAYYASVRSYESDTPAEEGPTIHGAVRLWEYPIWPRTVLDEPAPLSADQEEELAERLRAVAPLLEQARSNLAGSDARDLWMGGIRAFENQSEVLAQLLDRIPEGSADLRSAVEEARAATDAFAGWLRNQASSVQGPSGIGREHYSWFLRHVLLVPLSWEEEVTITRRELVRAHATLRLEEHRNRALPELEPASSPEAFQRMQDRAIRRYLAFLEENEVLPVEAWMERALRERVPSYAPPETRNFFAQATHREPMTLWTHLYHWWDTARMREEPHPSPIRRGPLLYNVWMSRSEGLATVMEEWMLHAGLYDDDPRAREIVWVMLATRAARGLASLYAHADERTMEEAGDLHVAWTPRGWMRRDLELLGFEQHLYLRQPGYGPSYVTGGRLLDDVMADRARQLGDDFTLRGFFDELARVGVIPVSLLHWELTGDDRMVRELLDAIEPLPDP